MKYLDSDVIYLCILGGCTYIHTYTIGLECILHYYTIYLHSINSSNFPTKGEGQFSYHISTSIVGGGGGGRPVSLPHKHQYCRWRRGGGEGQFPYHISTSIVGGGGGGRPVFLPHKYQYCVYRQGQRSKYRRYG